MATTIQATTAKKVSSFNIWAIGYINTHAVGNRQSTTDALRNYKEKNQPGI